MAIVFRNLIMLCCLIYIGDRGYFYYGEYLKLVQAQKLSEFNAMSKLCNDANDKKQNWTKGVNTDHLVSRCKAMGYL